jgi:transposase-like protein/IS1 family transposase
MVISTCNHDRFKKFGRDRKGDQRFRCRLCGETWTDTPPKLLGNMRVDVPTAKLALRLLTEGMSIRATERTTGLHRDTICKLVVFFGRACRRFLDHRMRGLTLKHLEFDEQHTFVGKKNAQIHVDQRRITHDQGDIFIWTCIDKETKLMPSFLIGKRTADNARRFMRDVAYRIVMPRPQNWLSDKFEQVVQISTDGFAGYPEAVDLAFGPYCKYGMIVKDFRNANRRPGDYSPATIVGTTRRPRKGMSEREARTIVTSHVERANGTQRLMLKRLNRLTYAFSKKLANLEAAFAMYAAYYNYCWQTRQPGTSGKKRPTAAMMAGIAGHVWSFDELFEAVLKPATQS